MKTSKEIKKGIECCLCDPMERRCEECPYADGGCESVTCEKELGDDALALIQSLEKIVFDQNMALLGKQNVITRQERVRSDLQEEIWQLKQQVPKWISVKTPPKKPGEYIVLIRYPDGRSIRTFNIFHPDAGWCPNDLVEAVQTHWMSFYSLPEPPKEAEYGDN